MISFSSSLASSTPATSLNVIFFCCIESRRARLLPKLSALLPPDCICRSMKNQIAPSSTNGPTLNSSGIRMLFCGSLMSKLTLADRSSLVRLSMLLVEIVVWNSSLDALQVAMHFGSLDGRVLDLSGIDLIQQIRVAHRGRLAHARAPLNHGPKQHQADQDKYPEHDCFYGRIHQNPSFPASKIRFRIFYPPTSP